MPEEALVVRGAREHNLRNIDVTIPRDRLTVITGLSGSGKSSLAFDTIYAEGQRRYVESLSAYARQFLEQMEKPDVDLIDGLSPATGAPSRAGTLLRIAGPAPWADPAYPVCGILAPSTRDNSGAHPRRARDTLRRVEGQEVC